MSCEDVFNGGSIGPCIHTNNEAILHVTAVRDTANNKFIDFIKIRDLKVNGFSEFGLIPTINSYSVVSDDSIYYCNVPFGFGVNPGNYEFTIEADGYAAKRITIPNVDYSIFEGGCPSFNDGGKRVVLYID